MAQIALQYAAGSAVQNESDIRVASTLLPQSVAAPVNGVGVA